jgi:hypothetical protein
MRTRLGVTTAMATLAVLSAAASQDPLDAAAVRNRLHAYLVAYQDDLGQFVATEELTQWPMRHAQPIGPNSGLVAGQGYRDNSNAHRLVSEVAFVPLPGNAGWLGYRDVRRVQNKDVARRGPSLAALLQAPTADALDRARTLLMASAQHNLGAPRTINLPSLPLELLHPRNQARFRIDQSERDRVGDCNQVLRLTLAEATTPTLIQRPEGGDMPSRVTAWVEPVSGALCRAEVRTRDARLGASLVDAVVRVDFAYDDFLDLRLPSRMYEEFLYPPRDRGEGEAVYSNYRRLRTSGPGR